MPMPMSRTDRVLIAAVATAVAAVGAAALWLRFFCLESVPFVTCDEAYYGLQTARLLAGESFEDRTTSGNILSPLYVATQVLFLLATGPTVWALRLPAAVAGLLAVALTFVVARPMVGRPLATAAATAMLALPAAVLFSRYGCEFSQTPLVGLVAARLAWKGRGVALWAWIAFALLVHPTNVFLVPIVVPLYLGRSVDGGWAGLNRPMIVNAIGSVLVVLPFALLMKSNPNVAGHAEDVRDWGLFLDGYGRFLTLATPSATGEGRLAFRVGFAALLVLGAGGLIRRRRWDLLGIVAGLVAGLVGFHLAAGATVLDGETRRYGAVLIAPTILAGAALLAGLLPERWPGVEGRLRWAAALLLVAVGGGGLAVEARQNAIGPYLAGREELIGRFRAPDPYTEAADFIRRDLERSPDRRRLVVAQDLYLNALQLEYLLYRDRVDVVPLFTLFEVWQMRQVPDGSAVAPRVERMLNAVAGGGYVVAEAGSPPDRGGGLIAATLPGRVPADRLRDWSNGRQEVFAVAPTAALAEAAEGPAVRR